MSVPIRRRVAGALVIGGLLVGSAAVPGLAGTADHLWVDDDGTVGPSGCAGGSPAYPTIQGAIDDAGPGDVVHVCAGHYLESVEIPKRLTVRSVTRWQAVIRQPAPATRSGRGGGPPDVGESLVVISANAVQLRGFRIVALAPEVPISGGDICQLDSLVTVAGDSDGVVIQGNRLRPVGTGTLGPCGYENGITLVEGSAASVIDNLVEDFVGEAIVAYDPGTSLTARDNVIHYWHADAEPVTPVGGDVDCSYGAGIVIADGATGTIADNQVVGLPSAGTTTSLICPGIYLPGAGDGVVVRGNLVRYAFDGINTGGADEAVVDDNRFLDSRNDGLLVYGSRRGTVEDNLVRRSWSRGIIVEGPMGPAPARYRGLVAGIDDVAKNMTFRRNGSFDNDGRDCRDETTGSLTLGTANRWLNNASDGVDLPNGICPPA